MLRNGFYCVFRFFGYFKSDNNTLLKHVLSQSAVPSECFLQHVCNLRSADYCITFSSFLSMSGHDVSKLVIPGNSLVLTLVARIKTNSFTSVLVPSGAHEIKAALRNVDRSGHSDAVYSMCCLDTEESHGPEVISLSKWVCCWYPCGGMGIHPALFLVP